MSVIDKKKSFIGRRKLMERIDITVKGSQVRASKYRRMRKVVENTPNITLRIKMK